MSGAGSELAGRRVAVTGASGFCGGVVARAAAAAGADVVCLGRRPGPVGSHRFWDATLAPPDLDGVDMVLHLAAAVGDPRPGAAVEAAFRAVNVDGTARLLDAAAGRPVVWVSSASVYAPGSGVITEAHPVGRQSTAYGRTKAAGERLASDAGAVVLRPRAVYGPGDPHLLPRLRRAVRAGTLLVPGPDVEVSLTSVHNLADACVASAAGSWPAGPYNIADARPYRRDAALRAVLGDAVRIRHVPVTVALAAAAMLRWLPGDQLLTRYAVEVLANGVVLDITKARAQRWNPREILLSGN